MSVLQYTKVNKFRKIFPYFRTKSHKVASAGKNRGVERLTLNFLEVKMNNHNCRKKLTRALCATLGALVLIGTALPVSASGSLSPALNIIAADFTMAKSGLIGTGIYFEKEDFAAALGVENVGKITIASLPEPTLGRLQLGSRYVEVGQTISERNLDSLKFVQYGSGEVEASFKFTRGSDVYGTAYECALYTLASVNTAPTVEMGVSASTDAPTAYTGVAYLGAIRATDREGDSLTFEVLKSPSNGTVKLTDKARGYFEYTSAGGFVGKDSFTVRVTDKYGNRSTDAKITVRVEKASESEVYADMGEHWANTAVITCVKAGVIDAANTGDKFYPDAYISRAEFLALAMNAAGYTGFTIGNTGFADDADIPDEYKGCIAAAEAFGIIDGIETDTGVRFYPNNQITRCEAAVILSRLTGITGGAVSVFADESIPAWAEGAMVGLYNAGILRGTGDGTLDAYTPITRGAAAQLVSGILDR